MTADPPSAPFRVLNVCTGNVCRSPYAEGVLRAAFARHQLGGDDKWTWADKVDITSAGTQAMVGSPAAQQMVALAESSGIDISRHVARQIDRDAVAAAGIILTLAREHRRDVVKLVPARSRVTFTLTEFARLTNDALAAGLLTLGAVESPAQIMADFVDTVASRRGFAIPPGDPAEDDIPDPYGLDAAAYIASADQIIAAVTTIETGLAAATHGIGLSD